MLRFFQIVFLRATKSYMWRVGCMGNII